MCWAVEKVDKSLIKLLGVDDASAMVDEEAALLRHTAPAGGPLRRRSSTCGVRPIKIMFVGLRALESMT